MILSFFDFKYNPDFENKVIMRLPLSLFAKNNTCKKCNYKFIEGGWGINGVEDGYYCDRCVYVQEE